MLGDGQAALNSAGVPLEKAIAFGRSIGSLYAIELAFREPSLAGLILESGIADPAERFLARADLSETGVSEADVVDEARRWFNHEQKLSRYENPVLILHAERDGLVDVSHAERNFRWAASPQKKLVRFPVGNHNTLLVQNHAEYFRVVAEFVSGVVQS